MFVCVRLLNGLPEPLWYAVPPDWNYRSLQGFIVQVPVRNKIVSALVVQEHTHKPYNLTFELKQLHAVESLPSDEYYAQFIEKVSSYYQIEKLYFIKRIHHFLFQKKEEALSQEHTHIASQTNVMLTDEQKAVTDFLIPHIQSPVFMPTVLHGITGSGKTEVYKTLFLHALNLNKTSLLLLPEVTLAIAFENRLKQELPHAPIFAFHSGKSPKEKNSVWNNLKNNIPMILIGVHLPILLPIPNLGFVVIDEEHDAGYQEKKHPKIHSKDVALLRAQCAGIPILLGSATPSISTLYNVKHKKWAFFQLKKRFSGTLPDVKTVFLTENKHRKEFWISKELETAITDRLRKKEQIIIFINRRGISFFVQCKLCSFIFRCTNCSVSLTLHENDILRCHYCGVHINVPHVCFGCKVPAENFLKKGIGTQRVVTILQKMFPQARIARADHDTTIKKKEWQKTIAQMMDGSIDILIGTQTITKGLHFPNVTLVGVLWADLQLHFPVYNAAEHALQQIIQVAGRAGRSHKESLVIIQSMVDHALFQYLNEIDYLSFYTHESEVRHMLGYPPHKRFAEIELKHNNEKIIDHESHHIFNSLYAYVQKMSLNIQILGPSQPPVAKIKNTFSRKIYCKADNFAAIQKLVEQINKKQYKSAIYFTPNPVA